jgi:hypothetical protein
MRIVLPDNGYAITMHAITVTGRYASVRSKMKNVSLVIVSSRPLERA